MSYEAKLTPKDTTTITASKFYFDHYQNSIFYCPSCNCEMKIQRRRLDNGEYTYFFYSNSHDKIKCIVYKKSKRKATFHDGMHTANHSIFFDSSETKPKRKPTPPTTPGEDNPHQKELHNLEFQRTNPLLENIHDYIRLALNSSIENCEINIGTKKSPDCRFLSEILFRWDNYENYHSKNLNGIGVLWGGRRFNAAANKIRYEKNSIFVQENLPIKKYKEDAKPILFELVFSSEKTKNDFLESYFNFDPKSTLLILVGDWERQPNQKGYRIYRSNIGRRCYAFINKDDLDDYVEK